MDLRICVLLMFNSSEILVRGLNTNCFLQCIEVLIKHFLTVCYLFVNFVLVVHY